MRARVLSSAVPLAVLLLDGKIRSGQQIVVGELGSWSRAFAAAALGLGLAVIVLVAQLPFVGTLLHELVVQLGAGALTLAT